MSDQPQPKPKRKRRARPKKPPEEIRDQRVTVTMTTHDLVAIETAAAEGGMTVSEFMRSSAVAASGKDALRGEP